MKIKLDENLPFTLAPYLRSLGHDADTVFDEGIAGRDDERVWRAAQSEGRFLITQDLDFSDSRRFAPGSHHGLLLLRLRDPGRQALAIAIREIFSIQDVSGWTGCFVVATERKSGFCGLRRADALSYPLFRSRRWPNSIFCSSRARWAR